MLPKNEDTKIRCDFDRNVAGLGPVKKTVLCQLSLFPMKQFFLHPARLVFLGGGTGSLLRYGLGLWLPVAVGGQAAGLNVTLCLLASAAGFWMALTNN